jgi:MYXO-CTERM domain-containing protein
VTRSDSIIASFADGPCDPLTGTDPELGSLGGSGGAGGSAGGGGDGGAGASAGAPSGGSGGVGAAASGGAAGSGLAAGGAGADAGSSVGPGSPAFEVEQGCGCRVGRDGGRQPDRGARWLALLGLAALPLVRRMRAPREAG